MAVIECRGLRRVYGDFVAVDEISLAVEAGELFGFLGPNGAGKTTTIKMLTGLLQPTSGERFIDGSSMNAEPLAARAKLGYVPDNPFLYEKLTGREFLHFMADLYGVSRAGRQEKVENLLRLFELQQKGDMILQGYSRGMRQKVALAGALIHDPKALFLDEPTVGLDPKGARIMQQILRELCRRGTAVFITTHQMSVAERLCSRIAIVNRGRIAVEGTPSELLQQMHAGEQQTDLEELFLRLTSDPEQNDLLQYLG